MGEQQLPEVHAAPHSPARKYMIGHIARSLGRSEMADSAISQANRELEAINSGIMSLGRKRRR